MRKITYPCETAAIFNDVVFVIRPNSAEDLMEECDKAETFFLNFFPYATYENVFDEIRYSFGGLYLNSLEVYMESA
ncbi:hypothetical protein ACUN3I_16375 [Hafnia alvei]|uniref:hypothetical protein n=1 Tax=Hafnia TaxID=568 RepID=UPI0024A891EE|nr:hypothetical protein [Hafnia paralvei]